MTDQLVASLIDQKYAADFELCPLIEDEDIREVFKNSDPNRSTECIIIYKKNDELTTLRGTTKFFIMFGQHINVILLRCFSCQRLLGRA